MGEMMEDYETLKKRNAKSNWTLDLMMIPEALLDSTHLSRPSVNIRQSVVGLEYEMV